MNYLDRDRKKRIFNSFIKKSIDSEEQNKNEEMSPAEIEREKELNKK